MITIIGSGRVGSASAMRIAEMNLDDVLLLDIVKGLPQGEALDISHSSSFDVAVSGSNSFEDMKDSRLIINTAGIARSPEMDRLDLMRKNTEITKSIAGKIMKFGRGAVVMQVANPVDIMSLVMLKETGFDREMVIGMGGLLDSLRFSYLISKELNVQPKYVRSFVIGEHGDSMVPLASQTKVKGKPLKELLSGLDMKKVAGQTRHAGMDVIDMKGSTFYAPSRAVSLMARAVIKDTRELMPASVYLEDYYGVSGIFAGVPARIGRQGVVGIEKLRIDREERVAFIKSCDILLKKASEF